MSFERYLITSCTIVLYWSSIWYLIPLDFSSLSCGHYTQDCLITQKSADLSKHFKPLPFSFSILKTFHLWLFLGELSTFCGEPLPATVFTLTNIPLSHIKASNEDLPPDLQGKHVLRRAGGLHMLPGRSFPAPLFRQSQ